MCQYSTARGHRERDWTLSTVMDLKFSQYINTKANSNKEIPVGTPSEDSGIEAALLSLSSQS